MLMRLQEEYIDSAIASSGRLAQLLTDILDLSRVEAGRMALDEEPFDLKEAILEVCELFSLSFKQAGLSLQCDVDPTIPYALIGDKLRIQQVLNNIVGNALKYTDSGQVQVGAYTQSTTRVDRYRVLFVVSDTGIGISDDKIDTLFQSFTQVSSGYQRQFEGAGLGLAICKRLAKLMGGNFAIESEEGKGTTIYFSLPMDIVQGVEIKEVGKDKPKPKPSSVHGLKILVVEDDYVNGYAIHTMLEKSGCEAQLASNGLEAIEFLQQGEYDVVLMDIQMPKMDGIEATEAIRSGKAGAQNTEMPIVAMTAYAMDGDRKTFLDAGMDDYVAKPVDKTLLLEAIIQATVQAQSPK